MVEKERQATESSAMGKRGAEHLRAGDCSSGGQSRANSQCATAFRYKGVRMRKWGTWVTEISDPQTKNRIWVGSFATEEMAARAYDSAAVSLKGPNTDLNFPDSPPQILAMTRATKDIQDAAAKAAAITSVPEATPLATSKKKEKKVSSLMSACNSRSEDYMPDQGERWNHVRENSAPSAPEDSKRPASLEEIERWIDNNLSPAYSTGTSSTTDGYSGTYLEIPHRESLGDRINTVYHYVHHRPSSGADENHNIFSANAFINESTTHVELSIADKDPANTSCWHPTDWSNFQPTRHTLYLYGISLGSHSQF